MEHHSSENMQGFQMLQVMAERSKWWARVKRGTAGCLVKAELSALEVIQAFACSLCRNGVTFYISLGKEPL